MTLSLGSYILNVLQWEVVQDRFVNEFNNSTLSLSLFLSCLITPQFFFLCFLALASAISMLSRVHICLCKSPYLFTDSCEFKVEPSGSTLTVKQEYSPTNTTCYNSNYVIFCQGAKSPPSSTPNEQKQKVKIINPHSQQVRKLILALALLTPLLELKLPRLALAPLLALLPTMRGFLTTYNNLGPNNTIL